MEKLDEFYTLVLEATKNVNEKDYEKALNSYTKLVGKYGKNEDEKLQKELIQARYNIAYILASNEQIQESIKAYEKLINLYKNSENIYLLEFVAKALINKANNHKLLQEYEKALESFDEVMNNFCGFTKQVAIAYYNKAAILEELQNEKEMNEVCDELIEKFANTKDEFVENIVSSAQVMKDKDRFNNNTF